MQFLQVVKHRVFFPIEVGFHRDLKLDGFPDAAVPGGEKNEAPRKFTLHTVHILFDFWTQILQSLLFLGGAFRYSSSLLNPFFKAIFHSPPC